MTARQMSRRKFIQMSAIAGGAAVVACSGLTLAGSYTPPVDFPTFKEDGKTNEKILVAYASVCGSTAEVAKEIANVLTGKGETVDLYQAKDVKDLSAYKSVVLGSAIRMGKWKSDSTDFVKRFETALNKKSTAFFTVCLTLKDDTEENRKKVYAYLDPVRALVEPGKESFFAGKLDYSKLSFIDGFIMKNMLKAPAGDYRKWDLIKAWAAELT
ncbi:MAG: flavodoxin domain-containing protein [Anaerolineaceae bacterium]|nr:flavodoxin domain-containing protein [Anaerolineaceae bacterium]